MAKLTSGLNFGEYYSIELEKIVGPEKFLLNLIKYSKHQRFILTNYFLITCTNSFNFFREDGRLFNDTPWIDFKFLFSSWDLRISDDLEELRDKIAKLENSSPDAAFEVIYYYPGKKNRMLDYN